MCCQPDHIGPPPGWYDDPSEREPARRLGPGRMAEGLAALASAIHEGHQRGSGPGRGPGSTEGGQGRALVTWRRMHQVPVRGDDSVPGPDWADAPWTQRPRR